MRCAKALPYVDAFADGELRGLRRLAVGRHMDACPTCAARKDDVLALRARIRTEAPRFAAPPALRAKVAAVADGLPFSEARHVRAASRWRWVGGGALAGCALTVLAWLAGSTVMDLRANENIALAAVKAHVRATLANQLTQVASTDRHTVKPWLSTRLDYSPPVIDLAAEGLALVGARIEYLDGRPVATLVYRYREHVVDVFVRPDLMRPGSRAPQTIRGFNVLPFEGRGMEWLAVSDASMEALTPLVRALSVGPEAR